MARNRLPKDKEYFAHFEALAVMAHDATVLFLREGMSSKEKADELSALENKADSIVHTVVDMLDIHRDPPLRDGGDIHNLVHNIDNIVDLIEKAADRIVCYHLAYQPAFLLMGGKLKEATEVIVNTMRLLSDIPRNHKAIKEGCIKVNDYESEGDTIHRAALRVLMGKEPQTIAEMWQTLLAKEVLGLLERALDQCEDVANFTDSLMKKNA